ncbi:MAG: pyruvate dehydrogenase complex dihydrolipoamide acetyltransferase [Pseudomonadota bacterium]
MPIEILMPALSPTMTEGNLAKWLKKEGDRVKPGDVIAEIETDKATMEVEAVDEGIMAKIFVEAGTKNVAVNHLIALFIEDGESLEVIMDYKPKAIAAKPAEVKSQPAPVVISNPVVHLSNEGRVKASPLAKRLAEIENVSLASIIGTGPNGRVVKDDILKAKTGKKFVSRNPQEFKAIPNNNVRTVIAKRLVESKQNIPHFYLSIECNIDKLLSLREEMNADTDKYKISINDYIIKAVASALEEVPEANASWTEESILQYNNVDISVAVAIDGGLITPIIRNANLKSVVEISNEMKSLAKRARENALKPEEFQGGGFSISNLGMYGIKQFQAIVNPPQSCIMAVGASTKRPIVVNDQITMSTIMDISISCDHRVVDGAVGAKFLSSFKNFIERPIKMIL